MKNWEKIQWAQILLKDTAAVYFRKESYLIIQSALLKMFSDSKWRCQLTQLNHL